MSRLSFRPRPLDIHKKLPIVKSVKDLDNDDSPGVSRTVQHGQNALDAETELAIPTPQARKIAPSEIPTPQFIVVDSYEKDYTRSFIQPSSYLRLRGARNESAEYVEYDLDDEDEDWLQQLNNERKILSPERFERMLYKMELLDHKARERIAGVPSSLGQPMPVALSKENAVEALRAQTSRQAILSAVYDFWRAKRERWQKPILRRLQPAPSVNDTNPFNVFRPREKAHRPHTRRMQRRENDVQSFEKLREVRRNLEHSRAVLKLLQKREEKKRELVECEVMLQRGQIRSRHDARQDEDGLINNSMLPPLPRKSKQPDEYMKNRTSYPVGAFDQINGHTRMRSSFDVSPPATDGAAMADSTDQLRRKRKRRRFPPQRSRPAKPISKMDSLEPVLLFTQPLDPEKLVAAGIKPPLDPPVQNGSTAAPYRWHGRMGRGGRIIFDRCNPFTRTPLGSSPVTFSSNPVPSALERSHSPPPPRLGVEDEADPPGMETDAAAVPDNVGSII